MLDKSQYHLLGKNGLKINELKTMVLPTITFFFFNYDFFNFILNC